MRFRNSCHFLLKTLYTNRFYMPLFTGCQNIVCCKDMPGSMVYRLQLFHYILFRVFFNLFVFLFMLRPLPCPLIVSRFHLYSDTSPM